MPATATRDKRRKVVRVATAYLVSAWVLAQVADLVLESFEAPAWMMRTVLLVLAAGFAPTLILAWGFSGERGTRRPATTLVVAAVVAVSALLLIRPWLDAPEPARPTIGSIAVLPLSHLGTGDDRYVTDGIHDDLLTRLAKLPSLRVTARTTVMAYRDTTESVASIARDLNVASVLLGRVQRDGGRLRINVQLVDAASERHLWSESYDRTLTVDNLFDIQSEITGHIVAAITGTITPDQRRALDDRPTASLAAWDAYSQARERLRSEGYIAAKYRDAQALLEKAVRLDPSFVQARTRLVALHGLMYWLGVDETPARVQQATDQLHAARELAPDAPEVWFAEGDYLYHLEEDFAAALAAYERVAEARPGDPETRAMIGIAQRRLGRFAQSAQSLLAAHDADPGNLDTASVLLETLFLMGQPTTLKRLLPRLRARFPNDTDLGAQAALLALWADGDVAGARELLDGVQPNAGEAYFEAALTLVWAERDLPAIEALWNSPIIDELIDDNATYRGARALDLGTAHSVLGEPADGRRWLDEALDILSETTDDESDFSRYSRLVNLAHAQALLGDHAAAVATAQEVIAGFPMERDHIAAMPLHAQAHHAFALAGETDIAIDFLERWANRPNGLKPWLLKLDPAWDFMRDEPRFVALMDRTLGEEAAR